MHGSSDSAALCLPFRFNTGLPVTSSPSASNQDLLPLDLSYGQLPGSPDEAFDDQGALRPHWANFLQSVQALGPQAFIDRLNKARRILRDDGATYNIYSDLKNHTHTWALDLIPSLISSEEWGKIEAGLLERAELFNMLLRDL